MFFTNARTMLREIGEIHVTHKENGLSKKQELVKQEEDCGLNLKESVHFTIEYYPGYTAEKDQGEMLVALSSWDSVKLISLF